MNPATFATALYACTPGGAPRELVPPSQSIPVIALGGGTLYYAVEEDAYSSLYDLVSLPLAGGTPVTLASGIDKPYHFGATSDSVFWSAAGTWTLPATGGTPAQLSNDETDDFAPDDARMFALTVHASGNEVVDEIVEESR